METNKPATSLPWALMVQIADALAAKTGDAAPNVQTLRLAAVQMQQMHKTLMDAADLMLAASRGRVTSDELNDSAYAARALLRSLGEQA